MQRAAFPIGINSRRHAADEKIALQFVTEKFMDGRGNISRIAANSGSCGCVAYGLQVFGKTEGIEVEKLDSADRKRGVLECKFQERSGCHNMQIGHFLVKIAQGGYGAGTGLDFIEEKEGFPRCDLLSEQHLQVGADTRRGGAAFQQDGGTMRGRVGREQSAPQDQQIAHLDLLLGIEQLRGIQWVPGAGNADAEGWPALLARIVRGGKLCQVVVSAEGALRIVREVGGKGFMLTISEQMTAAEAAAFLRLLEREDRSRR